jgi:hypothetical protein
VLFCDTSHHYHALNQECLCFFPSFARFSRSSRILLSFIPPNISIIKPIIKAALLTVFTHWFLKFIIVNWSCSSAEYKASLVKLSPGYNIMSSAKPAQLPYWRLAKFQHPSGADNLV